MAKKCDLSIELAEPDRIYAPGERVRGRVIVSTNADVNCKSFNVKTVWQTHGRGNTDLGSGDGVELYQGRWQSGQDYAYDFDLAVAEGPSTYHGHYLNVDHYVTAQVDIPWAFDPKAETAFRVFSRSSNEAIEASKGATQLSGCWGWAIGVVIFVVVAFVLINPFVWAIGMVIGMVAGVWWFFRKHLPARALGPTTWQLHANQVGPGEAASGVLTVAPPRDLSIEGVTWKIKATEKCTSGSGTNKTTHTHVAHQSSQQVEPAGVIPGGRENLFEFALEVPTEPMFSMDLGDNELEWTGELRVHIPRWPDWVQKIDFTVAPTGARRSLPDAVVDADLPDTLFDAPAAVEPPPEIAPEAEPATLSEPTTPAAPAITFAETAEMIWKVHDDPDQRGRLIEAIRGVPLDIAARVWRREFFSGRDDYAFEGGVSYRAKVDEPPMPLILYVPPDQADEFARLSGSQWQGRGRILDWCDQRNRLLVRVE